MAEYGSSRSRCRLSGARHVDRGEEAAAAAGIGEGAARRAPRRRYAWSPKAPRGGSDAASPAGRKGLAER